MSPEVRARAEALAEALAASPEYTALKEATEALENHEAAKIMLRDFRAKQEALQRRVLAGEPPSEAEIESLQQTYQLVAYNPYVRRVIEAEAAFTATLAEIQRLLAEAVGLEVPDLDDEGPAPGGTPGGAGGGQSNEGSRARSRLWVPGQS